MPVVVKRHNRQGRSHAKNTQKSGPARRARFCPECVAEGIPTPSRSTTSTSIGRGNIRPRPPGIGTRTTSADPSSAAGTTSSAAAERQRRRLDPDSPDYDPAYHERVKEQKRQYATDKLRPDGARYDPELHARQKAAEQRRQGAA